MVYRVHKIIDGVLYDTSIAKYVHSVDKDCKSARKNSYNAVAEIYIYKDGTIIAVHNGEITFPTPQEIRKIKENMPPEIYKKYFSLTIPGENREIKTSEREQNRLSRVEE